MIRFKRLDHVQICIPKGKENEARHFYSNIIGLMEIPKPEVLMLNGGLWYQLADIELRVGTDKKRTNQKDTPPLKYPTWMKLEGI